VNDLLQRLAADARVGLEIGALQAILDADERFVGAALVQADTFVAEVEYICQIVPEAVSYRPDPML
jgi:adenylosuccinate lyase